MSKNYDLGFGEIFARRLGLPWLFAPVCGQQEPDGEMYKESRSESRSPTGDDMVYFGPQNSNFCVNDAAVLKKT